MNLVMNSGSQLSRMLYQNHLVPVLSLAGCYHLMQVRWVDQTQYPMIVVASLSAVPQSCRTPLPNQYLDCMLLAVYTHTCTHTHTHTLPLAGWCRGRWGEDEDERGVKVRWSWRWGEELLNQDAKRGTQKKRGRRKHTPTHLARSGRTLKRQGKRKKAEGRRTRTKTSGGGGRTKAPEPTWHSENLQTPQHATEPTYLGREERMR